MLKKIHFNKYINIGIAFSKTHFFKARCKAVYTIFDRSETIF